jgi:hypothetical protein
MRGLIESIPSPKLMPPNKNRISNEAHSTRDHVLQCSPALHSTLLLTLKQNKKSKKMFIYSISGLH